MLEHCLHLFLKEYWKDKFRNVSKNIPNTNKRGYFVRLVNKRDDLIRRIRWKAYFFLHNINFIKQSEVYGFNSKISAPFIERLFGCENDLIDIVNNISFHKRKDHFQRHLDQVLMDINSSDKVFKSDKTENFYKIPAKDFNTLIRKKSNK